MNFKQIINSQLELLCIRILLWLSWSTEQYHLRSELWHFFLHSCVLFLAAAASVAIRIVCIYLQLILIHFSLVFFFLICFFFVWVGGEFTDCTFQWVHIFFHVAPFYGSISFPFAFVSFIAWNINNQKLNETK